MGPEILPDPHRLHLTGPFDRQVQNILENVRLERGEVEKLRYLFEDLEETLQEFWPNCCVYPFGSIVTGLGIQSSDVDCYIDLPDHYRKPGEKYVGTAKIILMRHPQRFQDLFAITTAKVPILKFFHVPTQRQCDISFKSFAAVRNTKLLAYLMHMDKRAIPLAVLIKYWSKVHKLTGTNLVSNYTLTLMVIFYLQQVDILPSVINLQMSEEVLMVDNWDTSFCTNYIHKTSNNKNLYQLLGGFFDFYSSFKFADFVISPYTGTFYYRSVFTHLQNVPDAFKLYKLNVQNKVCKPLKIDTPMCLQDPFDLSRNNAIAVHLKLSHTFNSYILLANQKYQECSKSDFLEAILTSKPKTVYSKPPVHNARGNAPVHNVRVNAPVHNVRAYAPVHNVRANAPVHNVRANAPVHNVRANAPVHNAYGNVSIHNAYRNRPVKFKNRVNDSNVVKHTVAFKSKTKNHFTNIFSELNKLRKMRGNH